MLFFVWDFYTPKSWNIHTIIIPTPRILLVGFLLKKNKQINKEDYEFVQMKVSHVWFLDRWMNWIRNEYFLSGDLLNYEICWYTKPPAKH